MIYPDKISPFLTSIDRETNELYVFHREAPQYLIWVKQETPMRFILVEQYDLSYTPEQLLKHQSLADAREYVKDLFNSGLKFN